MDRCAWCPLPATHPAVPPLLVSASFGPSSYSVHVTDLVHVWTETLDRRQICLRALRDDTPIDPTCDAEQMGVLLAELAQVARPVARPAAVDAARAPQMTLETASDDDDDTLRLRLTCTLPAPLAPLHWTFCLALQPPATVAAALVRPLLRDRRARRRESAFLIAALRDKDAVIARLVDKLDALGAGMETAFPGATRRGGSSGGGANSSSGRPLSREVLEERVRGLAPFDAQKRKRVASDEDDDDEDKNAMADLLGEELACEIDGADTAADLDGWWHSLGGQAVQLVSGDQESSQDMGTQDRAAEKGTPADDGFHSKKRQDEDPTEESTDDEDDDQAGKESSPAPVAREKANPPTKTRLGRLGGKKKAVTPPPVPPPVPSPPKAVDDASDTASETAEDVGTEAVAAEEEPEASPVAAKVPIRPPRHGGLGRIGKGKTTAKSSSAMETPLAGVPGEAHRPKASPSKPVGSAADRARQQERIENVVKQNAAPVRKKRKF